MGPMKIPTAIRAADAGRSAYREIAGHLNRAERRTAHGRLIVAKAEIARLEAENRVLRDAMEEFADGQ